MTNAYIDPISLQPPRFGEIYCDRTITVTGSASWNGSAVTVSGISIILAPKNGTNTPSPVGGALAVNTVPSATYSLPVDGYSLWVKVNRLSGTTSLVAGTDVVVYNNNAIPAPMQDWIPLFIRFANQCYAYGGFIVPSVLSPIGAAKSSDYEFVVSNTGDLRATHATIQAAIAAAADGNRILVLQGTYNVATATAAVDATAAFSWTGKTLTIEGEGWGTRIVNTGSLSSAFTVQSGAAGQTATLGNGSRILNLVIDNFGRSVVLDGAPSNFGLRNVVVEIWQGITSGSLNFTAPATNGGSGVYDDNNIKLHLFSTNLTPAHQVREYMLGGSSTYTRTSNLQMTLLKVGGASSSNLLSGSANPSPATIAAGAGAGFVVGTDSGQNLASLAYTVNNTGGALVMRDTNGAFQAGAVTTTTFTSTSTLTHTGLSAANPGFALVTAAATGGAVSTLAYAAANTASTLVFRDGAGNFVANNIAASSFSGGTISLSGLTASNTGQVLMATTVAGGNVRTFPEASLSVASAVSATTAGFATTAGGAPPTGPAGGGLSGTYPNPTVASVNSVNYLNQSPHAVHTSNLMSLDWSKTRVGYLTPWVDSSSAVPWNCGDIQAGNVVSSGLYYGSGPSDAARLKMSTNTTYFEWIHDFRDCGAIIIFGDNGYRYNFYVDVTLVWSMVYWGSNGCGPAGVQLQYEGPPP